MTIQEQAKSYEDQGYKRFDGEGDASYVDRVSGQIELERSLGIV